MTIDKKQLSSLSLGPTVAALLGLPKPEGGSTLSSDDAKEFEDHLIHKMEESGIPAEISFDQLLDELIAMDLPRAAIASYRVLGPHHTFGADFRVQFGMGIAHMLQNDGNQAKPFLLRAIELMPDEPAPYNNLLLILLSESNHSEASEWLEKALSQVPNYMPLWDQARTLIEATDGEELLEQRVGALAERHDSWLGKVLAADLAEKEPFERLKICQHYYDLGERDPEFLMEYTARLGMVADYQQIPKVIADAKSAQGNLPWQLIAHELEAYLAMEDAEAARTLLNRMQGRHDLPDAARQYLTDVQQELQV